MIKEEMVRNAIETILSRLNQAHVLGKYISHSRTEDGNYLVILSNGHLCLYHAELKNPDNLLPFRLSDIAARFRPQKATDKSN